MRNNLNKFGSNGYKNLVLSINNFQTNHSTDFDISNVIYANNNIDRNNSIQELKKYVKYFFFAEQIEKGIFEYTLTNVSVDHISKNLIPSIYIGVLNNLCDNLDINNKNINNRTLLGQVMTLQIRPFDLAYLSPQQLHPLKWKPYLDKKESKIDNENKYACTIDKLSDIGDVYTRTDNCFLFNNMLKQLCDEEKLLFFDDWNETLPIINSLSADTEEESSLDFFKNKKS
jgi:hypothetical protein